MLVPTSAVKVPGWQSMQVFSYWAPKAWDALPGGQKAHTDSDLPPMPTVYRPWGHASQAEKTSLPQFTTP